MGKKKNKTDGGITRCVEGGKVNLTGTSMEGDGRIGGQHQKRPSRCERVAGDPHKESQLELVEQGGGAEQKKGKFQGTMALWDSNSFGRGREGRNSYFVTGETGV